MNQRCNICGRKLDVENDPLSLDCGGDCWGCIGAIEADSGFASSLEAVREEFRNGLRPEWMPAPIVHFDYAGKIRQGVKLSIKVIIVRPLGEAWANEDIEVAFLKRDIGKNDEVELDKFAHRTNEDGIVSIDYVYPEIHGNCEVWIEVRRASEKWGFPLRENSNKG